MILRHLLSILLLPVVVTIVVPRWLQQADALPGPGTKQNPTRG